MAKRNISYIKPEDPKFLRLMKEQVGYDDRNPKFDKLVNSVDDFVEDTDSELPQVVVLSPGDLTAEEVDIEKKKQEMEALETKADLTQKVIFKPKSQTSDRKRISENSEKKSKKKYKAPKLSFDIDEED